MLINLCSYLLRLELLYYGPFSADKESEPQRGHAIFPQLMEVQPELVAGPSVCACKPPSPRHRPARTFPLRGLQFSQLHEPKAVCESVCSYFMTYWDGGSGYENDQRLLGPG